MSSDQMNAPVLCRVCMYVVAEPCARRDCPRVKPRGTHTTHGHFNVRPSGL